MYKYRRLLGYAARRRGFFLFILVLTVAASALMALHPWPMKLLVDNVLRKEPLPGWLQDVFRVVAFSPTPSSLVRSGAGRTGPVRFEQRLGNRTDLDLDGSRATHGL